METIIIHTEDSEKTKIVKAFLKALHIKFKAKKDLQYDPQFVKKIQESENEAAKGRVTIIETSDLWK
jgi:hypothetical protein